MAAHPLTDNDLLPVLVWIRVLGKSLIDRGVLRKSDLTDQFKAMQADPKLPADFKLELENMIKTVENW
jgi:hypothetical protein